MPAQPAHEAPGNTCIGCAKSKPFALHRQWMTGSVGLIRLILLYSRAQEEVGKNKRFLPIGNRGVEDVKHELIKNLASQVFFDVGEIQVIAEVTVK